MLGSAEARLRVADFLQAGFAVRSGSVCWSWLRNRGWIEALDKDAAGAAGGSGKVPASGGGRPGREGGGLGRMR